MRRSCPGAPPRQRDVVWTAAPCSDVQSFAMHLSAPTCSRSDRSGTGCPDFLKEVSLNLSEWLSPSDGWPHHSRGDADRSLAEARRRGWWLKPSRRGHSYGLLVCKRKTGSESPDEEPCEFRVHSTARGDSSDTAMLILQALENCEHVHDEDPGGQSASPELASDRAAGAQGHVTRAEWLTEALVRLLRRRGPVERCRELLEAAEDATGSAEAGLLEEAIGAEAAAGALDEQGKALAQGAGITFDPYPPDDPELLAGPARTALRQAEDTIGAAEGAVADELRERIEAVRQKLRQCLTVLHDQSP